MGNEAGYEGESAADASRRMARNAAQRAPGDNDGRTDAQKGQDRISGLADAAGQQQAYKNDYGAANNFAAMGQQSRGTQVDAMGLARDTAMGNNLQSQALGQRMLQQGVQAQQAGAASTRGGSLAQAAAMRQQAEGQGAFMQQGNNMLQAQRAAEMAQGRDQYMHDATGLRAGDAQGQALNQSQAEQQMQNELQQRQLNQQGQMGYDELGQDTSNEAINAGLNRRGQAADIAQTSMLRHQSKLDQGLSLVGAGASTAGAGLSAASTISTGGGSPTSGGINADGSPRAGTGGGYDPDSFSDVRTKSSVRSLATVALAQRGMR